jgi:hypothetical protein
LALHCRMAHIPSNGKRSWVCWEAAGGRWRDGSYASGERRWRGWRVTHFRGKLLFSTNTQKQCQYAKIM